MRFAIESPRVATVSEAGLVAELLDRFNREYHAPTPGVAVLTRRLERLLSGRAVVALLSGEPAVGIALLTLRPSVWYEGPVAALDELYVVPKERRRGIGTALLNACETVCRQRGCKLLEINVDGEDVDARRFYEHHGYSNHEPGETQPQLYYFRDLFERPSTC
jgi:GNAT superfamily N-acetyltransferase